MAVDAAFGVRVRVLTANHPREWRRGRLDLSSGSVAIGPEVVQRQQVLAISHLPQRRRDIPPPANPADPDVSIGWLVLAGALVCPDYLEQLREAAWPCWSAAGGIPDRSRIIYITDASQSLAVGAQDGAGESLRVKDDAETGSDVRYFTRATLRQERFRLTRR